mmetsp:Transcript_36361/g.115696  ORF Transcript_36361/g.115696 Transcript_36361/m.115696 type:complete len:203 (+) Transcript_36361:2214-2822(+)
MIDSSAERLASALTSKKETSRLASSCRASQSRGRTVSKNARAARLTIGFSSVAAAWNMPARSMYCGCERSRTMHLSSCRQVPHLARNWSAVETPPSARLRTDGTASAQRRMRARSSFFTSSARASSDPRRASWPLRSSEVTATSVARARQETRSLSRRRSRKAMKRSGVLGASGTVHGTESKGATNAHSPPSPPSQMGRATA